MGHLEADPDFNKKVDDVAAEIQQFKRRYPRSEVTISVDEDEYPQSVDVKVVVGDIFAVIGYDANNFWQVWNGDAEEISAHGGPGGSVADDLLGVCLEASDVHAKWGYVGVNALSLALHKRSA